MSKDLKQIFLIIGFIIAWCVLIYVVAGKGQPMNFNK